MNELGLLRILIREEMMCAKDRIVGTGQTCQRCGGKLVPAPEGAQRCATCQSGIMMKNDAFCTSCGAKRGEQKQAVPDKRQVLQCPKCHGTGKVQSGQLPQKPTSLPKGVNQQNSQFSVPKCPKCGFNGIKHGDKFCIKCGQQQ